MHKNTGEGGRRAKKGRVGNLFWSPHGADGREPEGLQANPTFFFFFFTTKGFKLNKIYQAEDTGRGSYGLEQCWFHEMQPKAELG